jgi:hypothetical protein
VFCAKAFDGVETAHDSQEFEVHEHQRNERVCFSEEIMRTASPFCGHRPDSGVPVQKFTFVTKVGDQICGVGYYK